jgi:hypothetical protein
MSAGKISAMTIGTLFVAGGVTLASVVPGLFIVGFVMSLLGGFMFGMGVASR